MLYEYTPPLITSELGKHADGAADRNLLARGLSKVCSNIDGATVDDLTQRFGTPLFVFSERTIRERARRARRAFDAVYPNTVFAWSYKTNYLGAICNVLHEEGWIAEVVSDFEYQKAAKAGIAGPNIIYNGPYKSRYSLEQAMLNGSIVQIDNWDELGVIEDIAAGFDQPVNVGIRIWMDTGLAPVWSKFGFALANAEAARAAIRIAAHPNLVLHTLHCHIGTYILQPEAYAVAAAGLMALREMIFSETGHLIPCLNLGGGFPSNSLLHGMYGPPEAVIPPIETYAEAIARVLNGVPQSRRPQLRLESGRHLVDDAGYLITSIVAVKGGGQSIRTDLSAADAKASLIINPHARGGYIVDAGVNLLYTAAWYSIGVTPARPSNTPPNAVRLYGCLCMNIDVIRESVELPPLETGDKLILHPVGAYNVTQWMQFISYRPAVVLVGLDGTAEIIRRREELADVVGAECLPRRLARFEHQAGY